MIKYRPEIDGLRAIAIVPVIFFHAGFESIEGGFLGVDIFFVISGFLITSIIIHDIESGQFTVTKFYERRVRRILPALFFVMLLCIPPAWIWMLPKQLEDFGQSLVAVALFISNVLFWTEVGYFQPAAEAKPLLHTWSLAVEEQYYVLFPLFMLLFWRRRWKLASILLIVIVLASFGLAEWASHNKPIAGFFLLPTRAWELLAGSLSAIFVWRTGQHPNEALSLVGVLLLVASIYFITSETPFPGVYALPTVVGTAMLLVCANANTVVGKLLGQRLFVGIGLISYSAYLFHQPLFAFLRILRPNAENTFAYLVLIVLTFVLAFLSWKYVETPLRKIKTNPRRLFGSAFTISFLLVPAGIVISSVNPAPDNYRGEELARAQMPEHCDFYVQHELHPSCTTLSESSPNLLIWGDSHAWALSSGLKELLRDEFNLLQITTSSCRPAESQLLPNEIIDYPLKSGGRTFLPACEKSNAHATQLLRTDKISIIVVAMQKQHPETLHPGFIDFLTRHVAEKIVFLGPVPQWRGDLPRLASTLRGRGAVDTHLRRERFQEDALLVETFRDNEDVDYISIIDYLCERDSYECLYKIPNAPYEDRYLTWDHGHLSVSGSRYVAKYLVPLIMNAPL